MKFFFVRNIIKVKIIFLIQLQIHVYNMISGDLVNKREKSSTSIIYAVNIYIEKKNKSSSSYVGHIVAFNFPPKILYELTKSDLF